MVRLRRVIVAAAATMFLGTQASAQVSQIDPSSSTGNSPVPAQENVYTPPPASDYQPVDQGPQDPSQPASPPAQSTTDPATPASQSDQSNRNFVPPRNTMAKDDVIAGAEKVFGRGAEGLGAMIESVLRDQGEPVAYIAGQEAGGAFVVGVRYGSGTMRHKIEGDQPVYWTGPSVGFDAGADASKVFVLVYNLHDTEDLFRRFPSAEGHAYVVGGFTASYLRRGQIVLVPIRLGVGLRLGVNAGYMKFSKKNRWLPL